MFPHIERHARLPKRTLITDHRHGTFIFTEKASSYPKSIQTISRDFDSKLPRISATSTSETDRKPRKDSIVRQCQFQKQKKQEACGKVNDSVVVEAFQQTESKESEALRRAKGEHTLDRILRSLKPAFRHSRGNAPAMTNVSNAEATTEVAQPTDQSNQSSSGVVKTSAPGRENIQLLDDGKKKLVVEDGEYDAPDGKDISSFNFKPTMEYVGLPFSKEKARVPQKKIQSVKHLPIDPLAKHRREKREFAIGFKVHEKTDSLGTLEDSQQMHQVALMRLCEAYTKNLGPKYLHAMARESIQSPIPSDDEDPMQLSNWTLGGKFTDDPNERLWNWDESLINSKLNRDPQGRPIFNKDLGNGPYTDSPDPYQGSMGPNDYDAKSDLAALLIMDSEPSTDIEFEEKEFIEGHREHPFTDPIIRAGGQHPCDARDRYLRNVKGQGNLTLLPESTGSMISPMNSVADMGDLSNRKSIEDTFQQNSPAPPASEIHTDSACQKRTTDHPTTPPMCPEPLQEQNVSDHLSQAVSTELTTTSLTTGTTITTGTTVTATSTSGRRSPSLSLNTASTAKKRRRKKSPSGSMGLDIRSLHAKYTPRLKHRRRRKKKKERRQRDPIELPNNLPLDNYQSGFEKVTIDWCKTIMASGAPNPMCWFEAMDAIEHQSVDAASFSSESPSHDRDAYGLGKRFVAVAGGLEGLVTMLKETAEPDQPKAEVLLDCMVKNYKLQMPLAVGDSVRLRELFIATIVKNPILYKMVLRRRNILPEDLQAFVARIIETTESSDTMLAALYPSKSNTDLILNAAKEMFASGYLAGGPPCPVGKPGVVKKPPRLKSAVDEEASEISDTDRNSTAKDLSKEDNETEDEPSNQGESTRIESYGSDLNYEKAFNISLYNPSKDILQEVAYQMPEFAYHVRPLFERKWIKIGTDKLPEELLPELCKLRNLRKKRLELIKLGFWFTDKEEREEALRVRRLSRGLVSHLCEMLRGPLAGLPGSGVWMALLACLHGIMFWPPIGDFLICKLNTWIPSLLLTLHSEFATVREEGCCVLSFLVTCYPLFSRLQHFCRHLLISNITFALLDAMERNRDSYACFHGTLGYLLHSVPCTAVVDCLLTWVPDIIDRRSSALARDWPLFIYYISRQWPAFAMNWNLIYERQVLRLLEEGLKRKNCKHNARLAIGYYIRRRKLISTMITCWKNKDEDP